MSIIREGTPATEDAEVSASEKKATLRRNEKEESHAYDGERRERERHVMNQKKKIRDIRRKGWSKSQRPLRGFCFFLFLKS
jgi:predicted Holliday junction resolvase-like endonuclease